MFRTHFNYWKRLTFYALLASFALFFFAASTSHAATFSITKTFGNHGNGADTFDFTPYGQVEIKKIHVEAVWWWEDGGATGASSAGVSKSEAQSMGGYPLNGWLGMWAGTPPASGGSNDEPCIDGVCAFQVNPGQTGLFFYGQKDDGNHGVPAPAECVGYGLPADANNYDYCFGITRYAFSNNVVSLTWYGVTNRVAANGMFTRIRIDAEPVPTGTLRFEATLDKLDGNGPQPWDNQGSIKFSATQSPYGPVSTQTVPVPKESDLLAGTYTLKNEAGGGPPNSEFVNITPNATQTLPAGERRTFTFNYKIKSGTMRIKAALDNNDGNGSQPWAGQLWVGVSSLPGGGSVPPQRIQIDNAATGYLVPAALPIGPYTLYLCNSITSCPSNGPNDATLLNITPNPVPISANTETVVTFNFKKATPQRGYIKAKATLNGEDWNDGEFFVSGTLDGAPIPVCNPNCSIPANMTPTEAPAGNYVLRWQSGGPTGNPPSPVTVSGTLTPSHTATNPLVLVFRFTQKTPPPPLTCAITNGPPPFRVGQTINFSASGGTGSYAWQAPLGNPNSGNNTTFSTSYASAQNPATVMVSSGTQNESCRFTVENNTPNPPPPLSVTLSGPSSGNAPLLASLTAAVTGGDPAATINYSFWWDCDNTTTSVHDAELSCGTLPTPSVGNCAENDDGFKCDGLSATSKSTSHTYTTNGAYTAKVIVERGTQNAEDSISIAVNPAPSVSISLEAKDKDGHFSGGTITLPKGSSSELSWTGENVQSCSASGDWSGTNLPAFGRQPTGNLTSNKTYTITCLSAVDNHTTVNDQVHIIVETECDDGIDNDHDGLIDSADPQCAFGDTEGPAAQGEYCTADVQCFSGLFCVNNTCTPPGNVGDSCTNSAQCKQGLICKQGKCARGTHEIPPS